MRTRTAQKGVPTAKLGAAPFAPPDRGAHCGVDSHVPAGAPVTFRTPGPAGIRQPPPERPGVHPTVSGGQIGHDSQGGLAAAHTIVTGAPNLGALAIVGAASR